MGKERRVHEFLVRGYTILKNVIPVGECDAIVKEMAEMRDDRWENILSDSNRNQIRVDNFRGMKRIKERVRNKIQKGFKGLPQCEWELNDWMGLRSCPGGEDQILHADWKESDWNAITGSSGSTRSKRRASQTVPASVLLFVDDESALRVVPKTSFRYQSDKEKRIEFKKGDLCVFRGDLVHGGVGYKTDYNFRIHVFLDPRDFPAMRAPNSTAYAGILTFT